MQKSATVALIKNNKLLLLKRGSTAPWNPDKYCLPGGKLEHNEELIECGARELYEETNILLDKKGNVSYIVRACQWWSSQPNEHHRQQTLNHNDCPDSLRGHPTESGSAD